MWDRQAVMAAHQQYYHANKTEASRLLRQFRSGNTIGHEACLLTSLAMVLRLLDQNPGRWSPKMLNAFAHKHLYYTRCGLSMATLYADLVCEASNGEVQLLLKEEYLSGEPDWPPTYASTCMPLRAYRALSPRDRRDVVVMIKTGKQCDTTGVPTPCGNQDFEAGVTQVHDFLSTRASFVLTEATAAGYQPDASDPQVPDGGIAAWGGVQAVSPGAIALITGTNLGTALTASAAPLPRILGNTVVSVEGVPSAAVCRGAWDDPVPGTGRPPSGQREHCRVQQRRRQRHGPDWGVGIYPCDPRRVAFRWLPGYSPVSAGAGRGAVDLGDRSRRSGRECADRRRRAFGHTGDDHLRSTGRAGE